MATLLLEGMQVLVAPDAHVLDVSLVQVLVPEQLLVVPVPLHTLPYGPYAWPHVLVLLQSLLDPVLQKFAQSSLQVFLMADEQSLEAPPVHVLEPASEHVFAVEPAQLLLTPTPVQELEFWVLQTGLRASAREGVMVSSRPKAPPPIASFRNLRRSIPAPTPGLWPFSPPSSGCDASGCGPMREERWGRRGLHWPSRPTFAISRTPLSSGRVPLERDGGTRRSGVSAR